MNHDDLSERLFCNAATPYVSGREEPEESSLDVSRGGRYCRQDLYRGGINSGNLEKVDEFVAPDHVNHDLTAPTHAPGAEGIKELIGAYRAGSPDLRF